MCIRDRDDDLLWLVLFIPPAGIPFLAPHVPSEKVKELHGEVFDRIKNIVGDSACNAECVAQIDMTWDFKGVLEALANVAGNIDAGFLDDSEIIFLLHHNGVMMSEKDDAVSLLNTVAKAECPPRFNSLALGACCIDGVEPERLLDFWVEKCPDRYIAVNRPMEQLQEQLLGIGSDEAIKMAASMTLSNRHYHREKDRAISRKLAGKYCDVLSRASELSEFDLFRLTGLDPHIDEVELWSKPEVLQIVQASLQLLNRLPERLLKLVSRFSSDHERLRRSLGPIIEKRDEFTVELSVAVVDALLRLDELTTQPLNPKDWQSSS